MSAITACTNFSFFRSAPGPVLLLFFHSLSSWKRLEAKFLIKKVISDLNWHKGHVSKPFVQIMLWILYCFFFYELNISHFLYENNLLSKWALGTRSAFATEPKLFGVCPKEKTSPPSAMSAMQHETFFKHLESFLETLLKHFGNTLGNHETPLKHPWNFLFHETFMNHSGNFLETPLKLPQNTLQSSL